MGILFVHVYLCGGGMHIVCVCVYMCVNAQITEQNKKFKDYVLNPTVPGFMEKSQPAREMERNSLPNTPDELALISLQTSGQTQPAPTANLTRSIHTKHSAC